MNHARAHRWGGTLRTLAALCGGLGWGLAAACSPGGPSGSSPEPASARSATVEGGPREAPPVAPALPATGAASSNPPPIDPGPDAGPSADPPPAREVRAPTEWRAEEGLGGARRVESAHARIPTVEALFADAGVSFPPAQLLFRVFKHEGEIEVWSASDATGPLTHVTTYGVCAASGDLGPKRREGDRQVPEGFYTLNYFNAESSYHLSMQVSYPNASDRVLGGPNLGGQIMIHGNCVSIGCLAMTDERIEELWVMTEPLRSHRRTVHVHIFPTRGLRALAAADAREHHAFWANLLEGLELFERDHLIPQVTVTPEGRYTFTSG